MRRAVARANRGRAGKARWGMEQAAQGVGKVIEGRRLLEATDGREYFSASYEKVMGKGWVFKEGDRALEFLRYCGKPEDARRALEKRRLKYRWR